MTYAEKLKDPRWQRKRLEILNRDEFTCRGCNDSGSQLSVHHVYYVSGRMPWEYPNAALMTLCEKCHDKRHKRTEFQNTYLEKMVAAILLFEPATKENLSIACKFLQKIQGPAKEMDKAEFFRRLAIAAESIGKASKKPRKGKAAKV